ncbi:hypothetical protein ACHOLT_07620 [Desulfitobacterium sp. Sab5]|uniref:hypothetical protein n=1 Tax=Desulfitobacterium nosdiversum TaxID=3375356 RepID=UPI003CF22721
MDDETMRIWAWRFALGTAVIIGILSWKTGVSFLRIMIRIIFSYLLMYGLSYGSLYGFKKTGILEKEDNANSLVERAVNNTSGAFLDVAVGQEDSQWDIPRDTEQEQDNSSEKNSALIAGQLNADLSQGMPDTEKQAEMVRRMGWGE